MRIRSKKVVEKQRKRAENVRMRQTNLIKLYCAVCDNSSTIEAEMQRQSNNSRPEFTDEGNSIPAGDRQYKTKAAYVALGITMNGTKDILGVWIGSHESSKFWLSPFCQAKTVPGCCSNVVSNEEAPGEASPEPLDFAPPCDGVSTNEEMCPKAKALLLCTDQGRGSTDAIQVNHDTAGLSSLIKTLHNVDGEIRVVMEHTGMYWRPIALALKEAGFFVNIMNAY